jgi:hypothetical protein
MPTPKEGESRNDFVSRCVPIVMDEGETQEAAVGKCEGIYTSWKEKKSMDKRAVSLSDRQEIVIYELYEALDSDGWDFWPVAVYEDSIVTKHTSGRYVKFSYTWNDGEVEFLDATFVEMDFRTAVRKYQEPIRAVKGEDNLFECCMVRFTSPDERDAYGTYFDENTNFYLDWYDKRVWLYDHTLHPDVGKRKVGTWNKAEIRSDGLFVQGELDRHFEYLDDIETLIDLNVLFPSSGTLSYAMSVAEDGHVDDWPFIEGSSTVTPADIGAEAVKTAVRAFRSLEGDETMSDKKKGLLGNLFSRNAEPDVEEDEQETPTEEPEVEETASVEDETDETLEEVKSAVRAVDEALAEYQEAIVALDGMVEALSGRMTVIEETVEALGQTKAEQVKSAMTSGSFMRKLFVAHRDANEALEETPDSTIEEVDPGEESGSLAVTIAQRSRK